MSSHASLEPHRTRWGRVVALGLGWTKAVLVPIMALMALSTGGQDRAGAAMAGGFAVMVLLYGLVCVAPALVLAHRGRLIGLSLALLLVPDLLLLLAVNVL